MFSWAVRTVQVFGKTSAERFLRGRSLAMAVMQDDVLASVSKDLAAVAKGAIADTAKGQVSLP